jgi:hypothetical protein
MFSADLASRATEVDHRRSYQVWGPRARMREFGSIDSIFGDGSMPKPCSLELREQVVEAVESEVNTPRSPAVLDGRRN